MPVEELRIEVVPVKALPVKGWLQEVPVEALPLEAWLWEVLEEPY